MTNRNFLNDIKYSIMVWTLELHLIVWSAGPFQGEYTPVMNRCR